nr:hypothetical protein [uncultured Rhodopila sp.]
MKMSWLAFGLLWPMVTFAQPMTNSEAPVAREWKWMPWQWICPFQSKPDSQGQTGAKSPGIGSFTTLTTTGQPTFQSASMSVGAGGKSDFTTFQSGSGRYVTNLGSERNEWAIQTSHGASLIRAGGQSRQIDLDVPVNLDMSSVVSDFWYGVGWSMPSITGTATLPESGLTAVTFAAANDSANVPTLTMLDVEDHYGGPTMTGVRQAANFKLDMTARSGNTKAGGLGVPVTTMLILNDNDNGTGLIGSDAKGAGTALNAVTQVNAGATYLSGVSIAELDIAAIAGSSMQQKIGILLARLPTDVTQGALYDAAISIQGSPQAPGQGWKIGLDFGSALSHFPVDPAGTLIHASTHDGTMRAGTGIDWSRVTFSDSFLKSKGFTVDGDGNVAAQSYKAGGVAGVSCPAGSVSLATMVVTNGIITHC